MVKMRKIKNRAWLSVILLAASVTLLMAEPPSKKISPARKAALEMITALGGESFLKLSSYRISGTGFLPKQTRVKINFAQKGEKLRSQIETSFWTSAEGFDGTSGWRRFGQEKPFKLNQSPLELFAKNGVARIRSLDGDSAAFGPDTLIEKMACRWLKTYDSLSGELWIFVEQKTDRPKELFSPVNGISARLSDYRLIDGIWFPHKIEVRRAGQSLLELNLDTVLVNPVLPDSLFSYPSY